MHAAVVETKDVCGFGNTELCAFAHCVNLQNDMLSLHLLSVLLNCSIVHSISLVTVYFVSNPFFTCRHVMSVIFMSALW